MEKMNEELSDYIKLLRFKSKLSQDETAKLLNVSRTTYNKWELVPTSLDLVTLDRIGKVFNEDIFIFFDLYVAKSKVEKEN